MNNVLTEVFNGAGAVFRALLTLTGVVATLFETDRDVLSEVDALVPGLNESIGGDVGAEGFNIASNWDHIRDPLNETKPR